MGPNGPELQSKPPVLEGRDLGRMIANLKNEKERAFAAGAHDVGNTFKDAISTLKSVAGQQNTNFATKLADTDQKYQYLKQLQKAQPTIDNSLRNILGAGEIGAAAVHGAGYLSPLTMLGVSGVPLAFTNPQYARAASKFIHKGAIPAGLASTRSNKGDEKKKGGLAQLDK